MIERLNKLTFLKIVTDFILEENKDKIFSNNKDNLSFLDFIIAEEYSKKLKSGEIAYGDRGLLLFTDKKEDRIFLNLIYTKKYRAKLLLDIFLSTEFAEYYIKIDEKSELEPILKIKDFKIIEQGIYKRGKIL